MALIRWCNRVTKFDPPFFHISSLTPHTLLICNQVPLGVPKKPLYEWEASPPQGLCLNILVDPHEPLLEYLFNIQGGLQRTPSTLHGWSPGPL
jgi:hypothetical protein